MILGWILHANSCTLCVRPAGGMLDMVLPAVTGESSLHCRTQYFFILRDAWQMHVDLRLRLRSPLLALLGSLTQACASRCSSWVWKTSLCRSQVCGCLHSS